jgi:biopolymer transport protein TolQ
LKRVRALNEEFEREFWAGRNLNELYADATRRTDASPMERIFAAGMREFFKLREKRVSDASALLDGARRAMRASFQREMDTIESNLSFLASVGSVSPYIGLFGTVWGIMHAFVGLSNLQQVTLATVAPGIAEALVATAIGLFAAIPAVIAYNRFARDIDRIAIQLETFIEEFSNILQRNVGAMPAPAREATERA